MGRKAFGFWSAVSGTMALLKLKEQWDQYKRVDTEDDEGRVALSDTPRYHDQGDEESRIALLDTEITVLKPTKRKSGCCVCCGIDCTLFWKAFAIVSLLFTLYGAGKLLFWVFTPSPTGLEDMPAWSSSLGCLDAPHYYNGSQQLEVLTPIGTSKKEHGFDITGSGVGTFVLAQGEPDATDVKYEFSIRSNDQSLLESVSIQYPDIEDNKVVRSQFVIHTPNIPADSHSCIRYDVIAYIPPNLKTLHVAAHAAAHVKMQEEGEINLDRLSVTLFKLNDKNMILPSDNLRASAVALEVFSGWIVGDTTIGRETSINTQRGDGVANVHVHPAPPSSTDKPEPAVLRTATGSGRTDIFYTTPKAYKRPIDNSHISARNGDVYLTYKESEFSGKIEFESKSYSMSGVKKALLGEDETWNYFFGDENGADRLTVSSRGWTGLYF